MLSLAFIRDNPDAVRTAIAQKNVSLDLDRLLSLDAEVRGLKTRIDDLRRQRNEISAGFKTAAPEERAALGPRPSARKHPTPRPRWRKSPPSSRR
jgi:seryl-tRNA synthetase